MAKALAKTKPKEKPKAKLAAKPKSKEAGLNLGPHFVHTGFWLLKSEPESYSIDQFKKDKNSLWTGVRNYLARNFMIGGMKPGDRFLFYHSNAEPAAIVGVGKISKINQPDITALDAKSDYYDPKSSTDHPIWFCCEVQYEGHLKNFLPLEELRKETQLKDMALLQKGQRLSIQPVTAKEFDFVLKLSGGLQ